MGPVVLHEPRMLLDTPGARLAEAGPLLLLDWRGEDALGPTRPRARARLADPDGPDVLLVRADLPRCARAGGHRDSLPLVLAPHARAVAFLVPGASDASAHLSRATLALRTALARLGRPWLIAPFPEAVGRWCAQDLDPPVAAHRVVDLMSWTCGPEPAANDSPRRAA